MQLPEKGLYTIDVILEDLTTTGDYELIVLPAPSGDVDPGSFVPAEGLDIELVLIWSSEPISIWLVPGGGAAVKRPPARTISAAR